MVASKRTADTRSYDAIVVGLGAMGSATLYHLAKRGQRVLGLEQFAAGHTFGSSHGESRIIREQYFEHPLYVPLVQRAYQLWRELEEQTGRSLIRTTVGLMIGPPNGIVVSGAIRSATEHGLKQEVLDSAGLTARFPAFRPDRDIVAVLDPRAGFLNADACNVAHIEAARRAGAEVHFEEGVTRWMPDGDGVRVTAAGGIYMADRLLLSAGAWTKDLLPDLTLPLSIERQVVFWLDPDESTLSYGSGHFPIYVYEYTPGSICYGFPRLARGVKAAVMHGGEIAPRPKDVRRDVDDGEVEALRSALRPVLPELSKAPVLESRVCLFTNTPDHDFLVDWHPRFPQVLVSSPCSGHGFKFASVLGEVQAELLTTGKCGFDISPFRIGRFVT
jgi:sarcosine oxidase